MSERKLLFMMKPEQLQAFLCLQRDAEAGDGAAACRLGDMYREGLGGLRYSPRQTYHWYARSAMAGDANGQNNLGACYEHALGCAQSYVKAAKWYRLAAAQELSTAYMNLGYCYLHGHGVTRDKVEALRLFRLAVEGGEDRAEQEVERLEGERGAHVREPVPSDTPQARPCGLGARIRPCDGPRAQLPHLGTTSVAPPAAAADSDAVPVVEGGRGQPVAKHLGLVGVGGLESLHLANDEHAAGHAGAGGPFEDRLEAGAESEHPGMDSLRVRGGMLQCLRAGPVPLAPNARCQATIWMLATA